MMGFWLMRRLIVLGKVNPNENEASASQGDPATAENTRPLPVGARFRP